MVKLFTKMCYLGWIVGMTAVKESTIKDIFGFVVICEVLLVRALAR